ncbi:MAG: orotate phosphoribosyltransferase [Bryobacteraceae bacterium]
MTPQETAVLDLFKQTGAYLNGHFRLTSGLHSPEYLQCALVLQHTALAERLGRELAGKVREIIGAAPVDLVASPAIGGLIVGHEAARALGARFVFAERAGDGKMTLRRGFTADAGAAAVVIEDVVTTGGSTREVVDLLAASGARVLAAGSIVDRSGGQVAVGVPRAALLTLQVVAYPPDDCPLCREGLPVTKPGSRPA